MPTISVVTLCLQQCQGVLDIGKRSGLLWLLQFKRLECHTITAKDSWPQLKASLGSVRSAMRPVETTEYIFEHFALMKDLYGKISVLGRVTDHWYRIEFQNRGAHHVHMLLWVAPECRDKKIVVASASVPREMQNGQDRLLRELVMSLQIHSCIQTRCRRGTKGESLQNCKYGFPYKMRPTDGVDMLGIRYEYA